jgi:hypothetical protein
MSEARQWLVIVDAAGHLYFSHLTDRMTSLIQQAEVMDKSFPQVAPHEVVVVKQVDVIPRGGREQCAEVKEGA